MKLAGGIISLISGFIGFFAAIITLFFGGVASAFSTEGSSTVVGLGWAGVIFSFLVLIFGANCFKAKTKIPGILVLLSAILGAVFGGAFVAVLMVLAIAGGILAIIGVRKKEV